MTAPRELIRQVVDIATEALDNEHDPQVWRNALLDILDTVAEIATP